MRRIPSLPSTAGRVLFPTTLHAFMKTVLLSGITALLSLSSLTAAPLVSGSLSDYVALGANGGEVGTTRFSEFTLLPGQTGAMMFSPADVMVNPINAPGMPGLQFVINNSASGADLFGVRFSYRVSMSPLQGATLSISDSAASGNSAVTVVEDLAFTSGQAEDLAVFRTVSEADTTDQLSFASTPSLMVVMDITLDGGGSGLGSLGSTTSQFIIPEPTSLTLLAGAAGLLALRRRRH